MLRYGTRNALVTAATAQGNFAGTVCPDAASAHLVASWMSAVERIASPGAAIAAAKARGVRVIDRPCNAIEVRAAALLAGIDAAVMVAAAARDSRVPGALKASAGSVEQRLAGLRDSVSALLTPAVWTLEGLSSPLVESCSTGASQSIIATTMPSSASYGSMLQQAVGNVSLECGWTAPVESASAFMPALPA